jgi:hypothetical protein
MQETSSFLLEKIPSKTIKEFYLVTEQVKDLLAFSPYQATHQHCHNLILSCQSLTSTISLMRLLPYI